MNAVIDFIGKYENRQKVLQYELNLSTEFEYYKEISFQNKTNNRLLMCIKKGVNIGIYVIDRQNQKMV